jgi:heme oxygenase (biliverdin-IX-beta and delta-forming)
MSNDLPTPIFPLQTLRFRLREKTAGVHRRLDAELETHGFMRNRHEYLSVLKRFLGLYRPLERQLALISWTGSGIDAGQRRKSHWLIRDLEHFGLSRDAIEGLPECRFLPQITTVAEGLGVSYVLEGATLGGQIIARQIHSGMNISSGNGGRFFGAYGEKTGLLWRDFVGVLDRHGDDEAVAGSIERSAVATFECFIAWMSSPLPAPVNADDKH